MEQLITFLDVHYGLICLNCRQKVMDPDKKKGQTYLKGKCPSCGKDSKEEKKSKRQLKKEKKLQRALEQNKGCRAKY
jgi:hypothetical protein